MAHNVTAWGADQRHVRLEGTPHVVPELIEMLYESDDDGPDYTAVVKVEDGTARLTRLTVVAHDDGRAIRDKDLRFPRSDALVRDALEITAMTVVQETAEATELRWAGRGEVSIPTSVRAQVGKSREFLAEVAEIYAQGGSEPTRAVAEQLGISRRSASRHVHDARKAGLLPALAATATGRRRSGTRPAVL